MTRVTLVHACTPQRPAVSNSDPSGREGSLEAPTRHPIDWRSPEYRDEALAVQGAGADLRHLPRLPPLLQPVQRVPDAVRCGRRVADRRSRRRRQEGLLGRRRPLLPVRHVLHDEVSVRAAASLERRLPAPDAARQGVQVRDISRSRARDKILSATDLVGSIAGIPVVAEIVNAVNSTALGPRAARQGARRASRRRRCRSTTASRIASSTPQPRIRRSRRSRRAIRKGRVVLFATCYGNRNEPDLGEDLDRDLRAQRHRR